MPRAEIDWKRRSPEGDVVQMKARHFGHQWTFFARTARYEQWQPVEKPTLDDWLVLLDGVRRRFGRGLLQRDHVVWVERQIRDRFPDTEI